MVGIGWTEMLVIGVVALIFIGPKELPGLMHKVGQSIAAIRRMSNEFQRELNRSTGLDTVTDIRRSITEPLKKTTAEIAREFNKTTPNGVVQPSGALKPADPQSGSVVNEIKQAAGLPAPAEPVKTGAVQAAPVKAATPAPRPVASAAAPAPAPAVTTAVSDPAAPAPRAKAPRKRTPKPAAAPADGSAPAKPRRRAAKPAAPPAET